MRDASQAYMYVSSNDVDVESDGPVCETVVVSQIRGRWSQCYQIVHDVLVLPHSFVSKQSNRTTTWSHDPVSQALEVRLVWPAEVDNLAKSGKCLFYSSARFVSVKCQLGVLWRDSQYCSNFSRISRINWRLRWIMPLVPANWRCSGRQDCEYSFLTLTLESLIFFCVY
jgi:hypothetical protein